MTYYFSHFPFVSNFIILRNLAQKGRKILPMHHTGRAKSQGRLNFLFLTFSCFIFENYTMREKKLEIRPPTLRPVVSTCNIAVDIGAKQLQNGIGVSS